MTLRLQNIVRKPNGFTNSRGILDREVRDMKRWNIAIGLAFLLVSGSALAVRAAPVAASVDQPFVIAQAMIPPTGMGDEDKAMAAANMAAEERMRRRFPQPVRVGDLIGLPVQDDGSRTIGHVRQVVRTPQNKIELIVAYGGFLGWGARPVAVPIEVVGILGRQIASLDMPPDEYAAAPTWQGADATVVPDDDSISIALARR
jgi:PRC-barrel domain